jgi:hypothetical protein
MNKISISFLILLVVGFLSACRSSTTPDDTQHNPSVEVVDVQVTVSSSPAPTSAPYVFKTSAPGTSTIHGVLIVSNPWTSVPKDDGLYLAPFEDQDINVTTLPLFVEDEVPQAEVDESTGEFVFTNIKPGRYVLAVVSSSGAQAPASRSDGGLVIINVTDADINKVVDAGTVMFP